MQNIKLYLTENTKNFNIPILLLSLILIRKYILKYKYIKQNETLNKKNIQFKKSLLLIAHPDDELFFFLPLVLLLKNLTIISLTSGNQFQKNFNIIRFKEFQKSSKVFKFNFIIFNNKDLSKNDYLENMDKIIKSLKKIILKEKFEAVYTFNSKGCSGHKAHISCFHIVTGIIKKMKTESSVINTENKENSKNLDKKQNITDFYVLKDLNFEEKYLKNTKTDNKNIIIKSKKIRIKLILKIINIYWSQMNWYRLLYLIFSNYLITNTLIKIN